MNCDRPPTQVARVLFDAQEGRQRLTQICAEIFNEGTPGIENLLGSEVIRSWRRRSEAVMSQLDQDFKLVVIGEFKRGKSTFINALLRAEVLPMDVTPETITFNEVRYGAEPEVKARLADGRFAPLTFNQLKRESLEEVLKQLPSSPTHVEIRWPAEDLRGLCLVDTPGTADHLRRFDSNVNEYLSTADAVIVILLAPIVMSENERRYLRLAVRTRDFPKILFVINGLDAPRSETDSNRIFSQGQRRIHADFPTSVVFGVSSLDELCRHTSRARPCMERKDSLELAFDDLRNKLRTSVLDQGTVVKLDRSLTELSRILKQMLVEAERFELALSGDQERLTKIIEVCEARDSGTYANLEEGLAEFEVRLRGYEEEAIRWIEGFLDRLLDIFRGLGQYNAEDLERHFVFFLSDALKAAVDSCLEAHLPKILTQTNRLREGMSLSLEELLRSLEIEKTAVGRAATAVHDDVEWNKLELSAFLAEAAQEKTLHLAGELLMGFFREGERQKRSKDFQRRLLAAYPELRRSTLTALQETYAAVRKDLRKSLGLEQSESLGRSLNLLKQARDFSAIPGSFETVGKWKVQLESAVSELGSLRERIWSNEPGIAK